MEPIAESSSSMSADDNLSLWAKGKDPAEQQRKMDNWHVVSPKHMSINSLPIEILMIIFSYLSLQDQYIVKSTGSHRFLAAVNSIPRLQFKEYVATLRDSLRGTFPKTSPLAQVNPVDVFIDAARRAHDALVIAMLKEASLTLGNAQCYVAYSSRGAWVYERWRKRSKPFVSASYALAAAAESGQFRTVNLLLQHQAKVSYPLPPHNPYVDISTPLWGAVKGGNANIVKYFCNKLFWAKKKHLTYALCRSVIAGKEAMVKLLLESGADASWSWSRGPRQEPPGSVLLLAAEHKNEAIFKLLLERGAQECCIRNLLFIKPTFTPKNGHSGLIKHFLCRWTSATLLRLHGADVFLLAAEHGYLEVLNLLLDHGVDIFTESPYSHTTALSFAAGEGHLSIVASLLSRGWKAKARTMQRSQALRSAVLGKHAEIARLLIESGVDLNQPSPDSKLSPLEMAIVGRDQKMVELLLDSGADVNRVTTSKLDLVMISGLTPGITPLHIACAINSTLPMISLLVSRGADPLAADHAGQLPAQYARANKDPRLANLVTALSIPRSE